MCNWIGEKPVTMHAQQQDTLFTIAWYLYTLTNNLAGIGAESCHAAFAVACFWDLSDIHKYSALDGEPISPGQSDS